MLVNGAMPEEERIVAEHFAYLQRLQDEGILILAGRTLNTDRSSFGIVVFRSDSEADAAGIVSSDPAVAQGVMRAELFPYRVALIAESNV